MGSLRNKKKEKSSVNWEYSDRLKELSKKTLGEMTEGEWKESQDLLSEHLNNIKEGLKKEWGWSEEDWHNAMSETDEYDEEDETVD